MKVRDIMTADVATAAPDTTLEEIAAIMKEEDTGVVPVLDGDELIGLITDRDIVIRCIAAGRFTAEMTADEVLSETLETVGPDDDVEEASRLMSHRRIRRLPVLEDGLLVGMLSLGDIAVKASEKQAGEALEEVSHGVKPARRSGGRAAGQGIANRGFGGEVRRQPKVVPIRNQQKGARKRRTG